MAEWSSGNGKKGEYGFFADCQMLLFFVGGLMLKSPLQHHYFH
jgi:hypothetical protein